MVIETRRKKTDGLAFTLLEMLLTVALLVALLAGVVYNFQSAKRGSDLEEGARQVEALIRFAGAHAASSGKAVQFRFGADVDSTSSTNSLSETEKPAVNDFEAIEDLEDWGTKLRVMYEVDPVAQPGVFVDLPDATPFLDAISERVRIEKVRMPDQPTNQRTNDLTFVQEGPAAGSMLTFYPDGSSQTADIILVSKEREDYREMIVHVDGVTGSVRTEMKANDDLIPIEWMDDPNAPSKTETATAGAMKTEPVPEKTTETPALPMPEDPAFDDFKTKDSTTQTNAFDDDFP
jgi:type II secretory pathway pseudopilin PulG